MAIVLYENGDMSEPLEREDFSVFVDEETGESTLIIPSIAINLSCEGYCDTLVKWIFRDIAMAERLGS